MSELVTCPWCEAPRCRSLERRPYLFRAWTCGSYIQTEGFAPYQSSPCWSITKGYQRGIRRGHVEAVEVIRSTHPFGPQTERGWWARWIGRVRAELARRRKDGR